MSDNPSKKYPSIQEVEVYGGPDNTSLEKLDDELEELTYIPEHLEGSYGSRNSKGIALKANERLTLGIMTEDEDIESVLTHFFGEKSEEIIEALA